MLDVHDDELGEAQVVEIAVRSLEPVHPRVSRRLISVPGVVGPVPTGQGIFLANATNLGIEHCKRVVEPVHPILADDTEKAHPPSHLDATGAGAFGGLDHLRLVALSQESVLSSFTAVACRNGDKGFGDIVKCILPGYLDELILPPPVK